MAAGDISDALVQEVLDYQFNSTRYSTRIYTWLSEAQKKFVRKTNVRTNEETASLAATAGASTLNLPSDFAREISLTLATNSSTTRTPLQQLDLHTFDRLNDTSVSGVVFAYAVSESQILLLPKTQAAASFDLRYWRLPATITTSVDPEIPADYHSLLVDYALFRAYASEHDRSSSQYHKKLWEDALFDAQGELNYDHNADGVIVAEGTWANAYPTSTISLP